MDILAKSFDILLNNKEFAALLAICYTSWKTQSSLKVQSAECNGKFMLQDMKIDNVDKKADEAGETAEKAFRCVHKINKKVDDIHSDYKQYIEGKHKESLTKQE